MDPVKASEFTTAAAAGAGAVSTVAGGVAGSVARAETEFEGGVGCGSTATATGGAADRGATTSGTGAFGATGCAICCGAAGRSAAGLFLVPTAKFGVRCDVPVSGLFELLGRGPLFPGTTLRDQLFLAV